MMNALLDVEHKSLKPAPVKMAKVVSLPRVEKPVEQAVTEEKDTKLKTVVAYTVLAAVAALSNWYLYDLYMSLF